MTGEPGEDDRATQALRYRIREILESGPTGFDAVRQRIDRVQQVVREESFRVIGPMLASRAAEIPVGTYEEKRAFVAWLNAELRHHHLAIRCPKTGKPTILEINPGRLPATGRFRFDHLDETGRHHTTFTCVDLPPLEFMPDPSVTPRGRLRSGRSR